MMEYLNNSDLNFDIDNINIENIELKNVFTFNKIEDEIEVEENLSDKEYDIEVEKVISEKDDNEIVNAEEIEQTDINTKLDKLVNLNNEQIENEKTLDTVLNCLGLN